jgi:predicted transglutaminase-like protease
MGSGCCVVTINNRVVLMSLLADNPMSVKKLLGNDQKVSAKAVTTASKIDGYSYFGDENCKVTTLEDWIERTTKDQRGKNGHL